MALSTANTAQASASSNRIAFLVDLGFAAGTLYVTDMDRSITVGGNVYSPSLVFAGVDGLEDNLDGKPRRISLKLSGLDATLRNRTLATRIAFSAMLIRLAFLDATGALVDTPIVMADAVLSNAQVAYDEGSGLLEVSGETRNILLRRDAQLLATDQGQRLRFAGDTAFRNVINLSTIQINWGGDSDAYRAQQAAYNSDRARFERNVRPGKG